MIGSGMIKRYMRSNFSEVLHTTLNPDGPGAVRIHLIPPVLDGKNVPSSVAIVNGQDVIPVNFTWAVILAEFIKHVNVYDGKPVTDKNLDEIIDGTCRNVRRLFPLIPRKTITNDLFTIMKTFTQVAYRQPVTTDVKYMSLGEYAQFMSAPHRMDLLVSAMTKEGSWHCNQKCLHCYACGQEHAEEKELSTDQWKFILDKCRQARIPQVTFTGGEPTMREDLPELIEYARWFITRLNTNGIKLTKEYCRLLRMAELDSVQITYYSSDREIHNALVGAQAFDYTDAAITNALEAGLSLSVNTPLCTLNRDYVKTLEHLHSKGVIYVTCSGLITTGNAATEPSEKTQLTTNETKEILAAAAEYCNANDMEINFTSPGWIEPSFFEEHGLMTPTCGACLSNMAVTPGGNVVPCQSWLSDELLGSMLETDWQEIWNNAACKHIRDYSALMTGRCPLRR